MDFIRFSGITYFIAINNEKLFSYLLTNFPQIKAKTTNIYRYARQLPLNCKTQIIKTKKKGIVRVVYITGLGLDSHTVSK